MNADIPAEMLCPISSDVMHDPVSATLYLSYAAYATAYATAYAISLIRCMRYCIRYSRIRCIRYCIRYVMHDHTLCVLMLLHMCRQVICADGHTYERAAITEWVRRKATSPLTNQVSHIYNFFIIFY